MKNVTAAELRRNLFRLIDAALASGEPIVVEGNGCHVILNVHARDTACRDAADQEPRWPTDIEARLTAAEKEEAGETLWR